MCEPDKRLNKENPALTRYECVRRVRHGGASIVFDDGKFCLSCHTIVTEEDLANRVKALGGPGHWLGCLLDPNHDGDCVIKSS